MNKILDFLKQWIVEIGFLVFGLLLMSLPTPLPVRTFEFGIFVTTILNLVIKHIIKNNTKS